MEAIIKVQDISKTFHLSKKQQKINQTKDKLKVAVDHLTFEAYKGEIYGLLGPNGAGKTTTLRMISTLIKPETGDIFINGNSVLKEEEKVRKSIGFLTSELKLEPFFTPNYLFDYFSRLYGLDEEQIKKRKQYLFDKFQISSFAEVKVSDLSTGMSQKVGLAISLVHDPDVIIFDEPTNGLDVLTAKVVTDYLKELRDAGKTIIVSTHIFSLVEKLCDRVGIILNGKLKVSAPLQEVIGDQEDLETVFFNIVKEEEEA